jgi:TolA-binding protein
LIYFLAHKEPLYAAEASYYLAQLSLHKCQFSSAKTALRKAITFYKKTPYAYEEAKCLVLLGQADLLRAKWHGAKNRFLAAINLKKNNDHPQEAVLIYQRTAARARQLRD